MRRSVSLPVSKPLAYAYQFYAFPLAILATDRRTDAWTLSNFIQLCYDRREQASPVPFCFFLYDYAICPWLEVIRFTREWIHVAKADLIQLLSDGLSAGFYCYLNVDEYYVPHRRSFGQWHASHDILVHGVDPQNGTVEVLGYDDKYIFRSVRVPVDALAQAYESCDEQLDDIPRIYFYRLLTDARYELNVPLIETTLREYLEGANTSTHFAMMQESWDRAYGMEAYVYLHKFLAEYFEGGPYDIRHFQVLWEHKRLMTARIEALGKVLESRLFSPLAKRGADIERATRGLRNGLILHEAQRKPEGFADQAVHLLSTIEASDRALTGDLLFELTSSDERGLRIGVSPGGRRAAKHEDDA